MLTRSASVPTVCASVCRPIHLAYDDTSFLRVVLCYQLHSPLPARKMLFVPRPATHTYKQTLTHTHARTVSDARGRTPAECLSPLLLASAAARYCGRDGHLLSVRPGWKGTGGHGASRCSFLLAWAVWSVVEACLLFSLSFFCFLNKHLKKGRKCHLWRFTGRSAPCHTGKKFGSGREHTCKRSAFVTFNCRLFIFGKVLPVFTGRDGAWMPDWRGGGCKVFLNYPGKVTIAASRITAGPCHSKHRNSELFPPPKMPLSEKKKFKSGIW